MHFRHATFRALIILVVGLASMGPALADKKNVASGKTQVVANLDGREITISDLRSEMMRMGLSPNDISSERVALERIVTRHLLVKAAKQAGVHRQPEALRRMSAAQDQALADLYLSKASQPAEPTRDEIEDYISANPTLFDERRIYTFSVLIVPSFDFNEEIYTPYFDRTVDFVDLKEYLDTQNIAYSETTMMQPSNAFPKTIREQLGVYEPRDNIVIQAAGDTQILKIVGIKNSALTSEQSPIYARRLLIEQRATERSGSVIERLKGEAKLSYYRASAAPQEKKE